MIISKFVKISPRNRSKWWSEHLGYEVNYHDEVEVPISKMPLESNKLIRCSCDFCPTEFERPLQQVISKNEHRCFNCSRVDNGNKSGKAQKGKPRFSIRGDKHGLWTGKRTEFMLYAGRVRAITNACKDVWSQWENFDKIGLCGVDGAYQLDHKVSISYGFYNMIPAEIIGGIANLEIITWESNREKSSKNSKDIWDLLG